MVETFFKLEHTTGTSGEIQGYHRLIAGTKHSGARGYAGGLESSNQGENTVKLKVLPIK